MSHHHADRLTGETPGREGAGSHSAVGPVLTALGRPLVATWLLLLLPGSLAGQEHEHSHLGEDDHHPGLHFAHPLVTESVSPDTKARLDYRFFDFPVEGEENSISVAGEYAVTRHVSLEAFLPYTFTETAFGNAHFTLKFANFAFEDAGVLLGYGVTLAAPTNGSPGEGAAATGHHASRSPAVRPETEEPHADGPATGDDDARRSPLRPSFSGGGAGVEGTLGTDEWEVEPFLNAGLKRGPWEVVGWLRFGIPFNQAEQAEVKSELGYNLSALYRVSSRLQALLELDGSGGISGEAVGEDVVNLSPGVRFRPVEGRPIILGASAGFPVTEEEPFDARLKTSLFWHF